MIKYRGALVEQFFFLFIIIIIILYNESYYCYIHCNI